MIRLQKAIESDLNTIHEMQKTTFHPSLEKQRYDETNPAAEPFERTAQRFSQPNVDYYLIFLDDEKIGAVRVRRQETENVLVQILILPAYQNHGYAQETIRQTEALYPDAARWMLDTIAQEEKLCHLYEKMGYRRTGASEHIEDGMDIVDYEKLLIIKSKEYGFRYLKDTDVPEIYDLCLGNPQYYDHCPPPVSEESIRSDIRALPDGKTAKDKHYIGFYKAGKLIAVMDLITHFPEENTAWIGFFMIKKELQRQGVGGIIIDEVCQALSASGFRKIGQAYVKDNPQAACFWKKLGFHAVSEYNNEDGVCFVSSSKSIHRHQ